MPNSLQDRKPTTLFFAGTDTDVGKTYTAALVAKRFQTKSTGLDGPNQRKLGIYKPVASGCRLVGEDLVTDDAVALWEAAGRPRSLRDVCPQRFKAALAPTQAATLEGKQVDANLLRSAANVWERDCDVLIIEGAGGLFSPLADGVLNIDLAKQFSDARLIVIAANRLGVIHQTLATCRAAETAGIKPTGIILCQTDPDRDASADRNADEIARYSDVPVLGEVSYNANVDDVPFADALLNPQ